VQWREVRLDGGTKAEKMARKDLAGGVDGDGQVVGVGQRARVQDVPLEIDAWIESEAMGPIVSAQGECEGVDLGER